MRVLIIGCGYAGVPLGKHLAAQGHAVFGLRRGSAEAGQLRDSGITPVHADITRPADLAAIEPRFDAVVNMVSSTKGGAEEYQAVYLEGTRNLLNWLRHSPPAIFLYTSSTSVYGQRDGSWVTEESPVQPSTATGQILVATEELLLEERRQRGFPGTVLRVAGIYGPGRGHLFKQFIRGDARIHGSGSRLLNMIHVEDLAGWISAIIQAGTKDEIYNLADDEPVTELAFFEWLSCRLGRPLPPIASAEELQNRKRGFTNKKVSNKKARQAFPLDLKCPTFREGYEPEIAAIFSPGTKSPA